MSKTPSWSLCVPDPEIETVLDLESGRTLTAEAAIGNDYGALVQLRMRLAEATSENRSLYACATCGVGVYLVCRRDGDEKRFHFRHRSEDGSCPAITRELLTKEEIEARKYNGLKEGRTHIHLKEIIAKSLACDPEFSQIAVEQIWKGRDRASWRKPDVRALWRGTIPVAFEIQLSTTFLHVIAERRLFYLQQGGLLCWVFRTFDADIARMTQDDVFFNNNQNLFLVSEETLAASKKQHALVLDCQWTEPTLNENRQVIDEWRGRFARFSEFTLDLERQRVFLFDYASKKEVLQTTVSDDLLREQFENWWSSWDWPPADEAWEYFQEKFRTRGIRLPEGPATLRGLLNALYSAKVGKPVGYGHQKLIAVAHTIADAHKKVIQPFRAALFVYGRADQIRAEDSREPGQKKGRWEKKVVTYKERLQINDPSYARDREQDPLIEFLFPEVWAQLRTMDTQ